MGTLLRRGHLGIPELACGMPWQKSPQNHFYLWNWLQFRRPTAQGRNSPLRTAALHQGQLRHGLAPAVRAGETRKEFTHLTKQARDALRKCASGHSACRMLNNMA